MPVHPVAELRNIVLVGHGAVGKTSLADLMLYKSGVNKRLGSPDQGTSFLDTEDDEKQRHHSITSHVCHFDHNNVPINSVSLHVAPCRMGFIGVVPFRRNEQVNEIHGKTVVVG